MPTGDRRLSRRVLLAGSAGAATLAAGCDRLVGEVDDGPGSADAVPTTEPAVDADEQLTDTVTTVLAEAAAAAAATGDEHPALAAMATEYHRLHEAHGRVLGGLPPAARPTVPTRRQRARRDLLAVEARLQQDLVDASMDAGSGGLAQTFAAMAAAVAQLRERTA